MMLRDQPFMRDDTFLGVCETLGDGLRIPSNLLRVAIAPALIWETATTLAIYLAAGVLIALLHWLIPAPAVAPAAALHAPEKVAPAIEEEPLVELAKAA